MHTRVIPAIGTPFSNLNFFVKNCWISFWFLTKFPKFCQNFAEFLLGLYQFFSGFFQAKCSNFPELSEAFRSLHAAPRDRYQFRRTQHAPRCPLFLALSAAPARHGRAILGRPASRTSRPSRSRSGTAASGTPGCAPMPSPGCQFLATFRQNVARVRLYRHPFLQVNMRLSAFFKIYQIFKLKFLKFGSNLQILRHLRNFCWNFTKIAVFSNRIFCEIF